MSEILQSIPFILGALLCVTLIDTVGAISSRVFHFNYAYLTVFSLTVYTLVGYYVSGGVTMVLLSSLVVGFYDATVGWDLSKLCKPNLGAFKDEEAKVTRANALTSVLFIAPLFALIGYALR